MSVLPSRILEDAVNQFSSLPGVGKKTALRFVLHLLKQNENDVKHFGTALIQLKEEICFCKNCHNISDGDLCEICNNPSRNKALLCVVEDVRDVIAIENTNQYKGLYHVLGGVISPMDGIGPSDLNINSLLQKVSTGAITEIILALKTTIEGDTTNFYLFKKLKDFDVKFSIIARGISVGDELEYTDEITLGRSIVSRTVYSGG